MTLEDLRAEFADQVIGLAIYAEVRSAARLISGKYDPRKYAGGASQWTDALEDLVQEVIVSRLLGQGQLAYAFDVAADLEHLRRLIARQVRFTLVERRERDVVDNLVTRTKEILEAPPYAAEGQGSARQYCLSARPVDSRAPTTEELRSASLAIAGIPRRRSGGTERAPVIYDAEALNAVVHAFARSLSCPFSLRDLEDVLRATLTPWLLSELMSTDEGASEVVDPELSPEDQAEVTATTNSILMQLSGDDRYLLALKLANASDGDIALTVGISRPTLAKRKKRVFAAIGSHLADTSDAVREEVVRQLAVRANEPPRLS